MQNVDNVLVISKLVPFYELLQFRQQNKSLLAKSEQQNENSHFGTSLANMVGEGVSTESGISDVSLCVVLKQHPTASAYHGNVKMQNKTAHKSIAQ